MPISAFGGRCPSCGAELPPEPTSKLPGPRGPRRPMRQRRSPLRPLAIGLGIVVALAALAGGTWYLSRTSAEIASAASEGPAPTPTPTAPALADDPLELHRAIVVARRRAQSWEPEAQLVSIVIDAVDGGRVAAGGKIEVQFGKSKNGQLGPRAPITSERLTVTVTADAPRVSESKAVPTESVAEPNCPLEQAWRKMVASGIPSNATLELTYQLSKQHDRAVWNARVTDDPELSRVLDGNNCAILSR